jgi:hypothetical protein
MEPCAHICGALNGRYWHGTETSLMSVKRRYEFVHVDTQRVCTEWCSGRNPTNQNIKGGFLRKRDTSSLANLNHSCAKHTVGNGKRCLTNYKFGYCYADAIVVAVKTSDTFRLEATASGGSMIPWGSLCFTKRALFVWKSGIWIQNDYNPFGWWSVRLGVESIWLWPPRLGQMGCAPSQQHGKPQSESSRAVTQHVASTWIRTELNTLHTPARTKNEVSYGQLTWQLTFTEMSSSDSTYFIARLNLISVSVLWS